LQGLILRPLPSPRAAQITVYPIVVSVAAATTRIIHYPTEFQGLAQGVLILNRDAANTITIIINDDRRNSFTISGGASIAFNDLWIEQIEVTAGAAGVTIIQAGVTPRRELNI